MRELTLSEVDQVSGGSDILALIQEWAALGGSTGSILGYAATGTLQGATKWGFWGGGIGLAAGLGWGVGTAIYDNYLS
ncbi:MAG: hypothetical protein P8M72_05665 [Gammaproteobacteria bacterium]|nr:hypothetical protein [Gammaproteobacteria bacterium]